MPEQDLIERLDAAVETLFRPPDKASLAADGELKALWRIAADLTLLPKEGFKARLKRAIQEGRDAMTTMTTEAPADVYRAAMPMLTVKDPAAAIAFYVRAFGAKETMRLTEPGGAIAHAEFEIGEAQFMLGYEYPQLGLLSPEALGGSPVRIHLMVDDVDALVDRAYAAGAKVLSPPSDQFYGHRSARLQDPFGHTWGFSTKKADMTTVEMQRRLNEMLQDAKPQERKPKPVRQGFHTVTPYLVVERVAPFLDFLKKAFGAEELMRAEGGSAGGTHAEAKIGDSIVMLGGDAPERAKPYPAVLYLYLPDVDQTYATALNAGATSLTPPADQPYGDRAASVKDPFGNTWYLATHVKDV
jgi:PhnB protein